MVDFTASCSFPPLRADVAQVLVFFDESGARR